MDLSEAFDKIKERQAEICRLCNKPVLECECQMAAVGWVPDRPNECEHC